MFNGGLVVRDVADAAFDVSVTLTAPLPEPEAGDTVAHETGLEAVHEQLFPLAFTRMANGPPPLTASVPLAKMLVEPQGVPELLGQVAMLISRRATRLVARRMRRHALAVS